MVKNSIAFFNKESMKDNPEEKHYLLKKTRDRVVLESIQDLNMEKPGSHFIRLDYTLGDEMNMDECKTARFRAELIKPVDYLELKKEEAAECELLHQRIFDALANVDFQGADPRTELIKLHEFSKMIKDERKEK